MSTIKNLLMRRIVMSSGYSLKGLRACFVHEEAFKVEVAVACVLIPLGLYLGDTDAERMLLAGSVLWVMIVEVLNSAVEAAVDRIGLERAELSGRAKDLGSAAVFLTVGLAIMTWVVMLT